MGGFKDVIGYKEIIEYVQNAVKLDKVSHAYIINGERGTGKKMLANLFARTLLCEESNEDPCGRCKSCRQAEGLNNPDIIVVDHEKPNSISVNEIRANLVNDVAIKPYAAKYKVYIVPEADKMTEQAQNALLKTIEEPPEYVVIFLLTEKADVLLQTIQSRCVMLKLRNIKDTLVKSYLMHQLELSEYQAGICAAFAQGNIGKAVMLAKSDYFIEIKNEVIDMMKNINRMDIEEVINRVKAVSSYKIHVTDYFDLITIWYRDVLIYKATQNINRMIFADQISAIEERATLSSYEGIENILDAIEKAKARLKANVNFEVVIELLLLTIKEN